MNIDFRVNPFPHIFIDQFFDPKTYESVWREILHLYPKMVPPTDTGAARDHRGVPRKKGVGIFLEEIYKNGIYSDIVMSYMQILSNDFKFNISRFTEIPEALYFKLYRLMSSNSGILVQLYCNGDYYRPHEDTSIFTSVTVLNSQEKKYTGGEMFFPEYNHMVNLENNQMIIFPSIVVHEVKEIHMQSDNPEDGRFSISMLMNAENTRIES